MKEDNQTPISPERIISRIAEYYSVSPKDVTGANSNANAITARKEAIWMIRFLTNLSVSEIAELFDGYDNQSIFHTIREVESASNSLSL